MADAAIDSNLDLAAAAVRYLRLLTKIYLRQYRGVRRGESEDPLFHAIYRYEKCWLPLLSEYTGGALLKPPWDVYYVWCLHVLTSAKYRDYCKAKYGRILDHHFEEDPRKEDQARERAKVLWESRFPEEMFDASPNGSITEPDSAMNATIVESEQKQMTFFYHISLSHFRDSKFIRSAVDRYQKLLLLKQQFPAADLCPTNDLEVIRQAHILHPQKYEADLQRILGENFEEFKSMEQAFNRIESYDFEETAALEATRRLWTAKYKTTYDVAGIRHRGLRELSMFADATQVHLRQSEPENIMVTLDDIKIADLWSKDQKITVEARKLGKTAYTYDVVFRVGGTSGKAISTKRSGSQRFLFNLRDNRAVELHTFGTKGRFCMRKEEHVATTFFDPRKLYEDGEKMVNRELLVEVPRISYGDPTVSFQCKVEVINKAKPHVFTLYREHFSQGPIPKDLKPFTKSPTWAELETFGMDSVHSARHSIRTPGAWGSNFACHVVACRDLDLGGVLLYEDITELVAAAHTIGDDQLPLPEQVSSNFSMSLDRSAGQHAMLIRNKYGDWGLCIMKKHPETEGMVIIAFENLQEETQVETTFTFEQSTVVQIDEMSVDLVSGQVTLEPNCAEAAEYVTLAYVIGVLYVFTSGHQAPEVQRQASRDSIGDATSATLPSLTEERKNKSTRAHSSRYDVSTGTLKLQPNGTLSNLKSRRKKKTLICTMLLACGLQANMMVEEDLADKAFHSEVSLLKADESDNGALTSSPRGMDDIHRHSFYTQIREDRRELDESRKAAEQNGGFLSPSSSQFTFRRPEQQKPTAHAQQGHKTSIVLGEQARPSPTLEPRESLRESTTMSDSWPPMPTYNEDEPLYDAADFATSPEHLEQHRTRNIVDLAMENAVITSGTMTVGVETRHQHTNNFISEGDDLPPSFFHSGTESPHRYDKQELVGEEEAADIIGGHNVAADSASDSYTVDSDSDDEDGEFTYTINDITDDLSPGIKNPAFVDDYPSDEFPFRMVKPRVDSAVDDTSEDTRL